MRPNRGFRLLALTAAASAWALVAVGGIVRVTESGLGCPDWPLCDGRVVPAHQKEPIIETSHRWVAGLVTVLVVLVALWAWRRYRRRRDVVVPAITAVLLVPAQALLGAIVVWLELPGWIVGAHFVVGMLFLAATVLTTGAAWRGDADARASEGFVRLAWPDCNGAFASGGTDAWLHCKTGNQMRSPSRSSSGYRSSSSGRRAERTTRWRCSTSPELRPSGRRSSLSSRS